MKKRNKLSILLLFVMLGANTACEVTQDSIENVSNNVSSSMISTSNKSTSTIILSSSSLLNRLPKEAQEFVDSVNNIVVDINAGEDIANAFVLYDSLVDWDYAEVLEAFDKLCLYEEQYNLLLSNYDKVELFLEKVFSLPNELTLDDEYLIIRAEEAYARLNDEIKTLPEVVFAYEIIETYRTKFDKMYLEAIEKKDAEDVAAFLSFVNTIPDSTDLSYTHYFKIQNGLEMYSLLSETAKIKDGVEEAYNKLVNSEQYINIQDGAGLFEINIIHKASNYECMLDIQGIDEEHKVTGTNKVFELQIYENNNLVPNTKLLKWGDSPSDKSYTRENGIHSFSFTLNKYYVAGADYRLNFVIETDAGESYAISIMYLVDGSFTCHGYTASEFYNSMLTKRVAELPRDDYSQTNWDKIQDLLNEALGSLEKAANSEHAKMICNQYYSGILAIETRFINVEGLQIAEVSSVADTIGNIIDGNTGSRWQAATTGQEYVVIDLGEVKTISGLDIIWEAANAKNYSIKVSNENANWDSVETIVNFENGLAGGRTDKLRFAENIEGQFIRLDFTVASMNYGYSIFELYVLQDRA